MIDCNKELAVLKSTFLERSTHLLFSTSANYGQCIVGRLVYIVFSL